MRYDPTYDRLLAAIARAWRTPLYRRRVDWRRIHRLFAIGRQISEERGTSAPPCAVAIEGGYVTCDGEWTFDCRGTPHPLATPFHVVTRAPLFARRTRVGSGDYGVPILGLVAWE